MSKKNDVLSKKKKRLIFYILLMLWPVVQFCIFDIGVKINSILLAFKEYTIVDNEITVNFVGFKQFEKCFYEIFNNANISRAFVNSGIAYLVGAIISSSLALFFSFYIFKDKFGSKFFRILLFLPSIISPIVLTTMFSSLVDSGIPEYLMSIYGREFPRLLSNTNTSFITLNFYAVWVGFGTSILVYNGSMSGIDVSVLEAAQLDGATGIKEFIHIIFPLIYPTFLTFFVVGLSNIFTNQLNAFNFWASLAPSKNWTIGYYLYNRIYSAGTDDSQLPWLSAFGLFLTFIVVPTVLIVKKALTKIGPSVD